MFVFICEWRWCFLWLLNLDHLCSGASITDRGELAFGVASASAPDLNDRHFLVFVCVVCVGVSECSWRFELMSEKPSNGVSMYVGELDCPLLCCSVSRSCLMSDHHHQNRLFLFVFLVPGPSEIQTVRLRQTQKDGMVTDGLVLFKAEKRNLHSQVSTEVCTGMFMPIRGSPLLLLTLPKH